MKKQLLVLLISVPFSIHAQNPDWSVHIAPILYKNCVSCHHTGGIAPFSLITYNDAVIHASDIQYQVTTGKMPPWPPDPQYNRLAHERVLTPSEINDINDWVNSFTPLGDTTLAPVPPVFTPGAILPGTPDLKVQILFYTVNSTADMYRCFVIPSGLLTSRYFSAMEIIPGNSSIVHHVLAYYDTTGACAALDAQDTLPGYTSFGGVGSNSAVLMGGWVPGTIPYPLPQGMGIRIAANADVVLQIHYPAGSSGQGDSTSINFFFYPQASVVRNVIVAPILNHFFTMTNGPLVIPANTTQTFHEQFQLPPINISLLAIGPHMHLIGRNIVSYAVTPATDTIPFIRINDWDFHWQGFYQFPKVLKVPASSMLHASAFYDNTVNNPHNPNNPPQTVYAGESTTDEMMLVYFFYLFYQNGDENIIIDSNIVSGIHPLENEIAGNEMHLYGAFPDASGNSFVLRFYNPAPAPVTVQMADVSGKILFSMNEKFFSAGIHEIKIASRNFNNGLFLVSLTEGNKMTSGKVLLMR